MVGQLTLNQFMGVQFPHPEPTKSYWGIVQRQDGRF